MCWWAKRASRACPIPSCWASWSIPKADGNPSAPLIGCEPWAILRTGNKTVSRADRADGASQIRPPSIDRMAGWPSLAPLIECAGRPLVVETLRTWVAEKRGSAEVADETACAAWCSARLEAFLRPSQRRVFNLTGTVLHTNLGRVVLAEEAIAAAVEAMRSPTTLEYDLGGGARGERDDHIAPWLCRLTGAEAATAVNNNAAAVLLVLSELAAGREVIVSRGELIEIGGAFRIPDIMARAGCRLVEVGTTNRTHLKDYAAAIGPDTAAIMKVHPSNYAIQGFTKSVGAAELVPLAREKGVTLIEDLGSGTLADLETWGLPHEPTAREAVES
eukprot:gene797-1054_t